MLFIKCTLPLLFSHLIPEGSPVARGPRGENSSSTLSTDKGLRIEEATLSCGWDTPEGPNLALSCRWQFVTGKRPRWLWLSLGRAASCPTEMYRASQAQDLWEPLFPGEPCMYASSTCHCDGAQHGTEVGSFPHQKSMGTLWSSRMVQEFQKEWGEVAEASSVDDSLGAQRGDTTGRYYWIKIWIDPGALYYRGPQFKMDQFVNNKLNMLK